MYDTTPPGTVAGLAWTSMGGSALYVESTVVKTEKDKGRGRQNQISQNNMTSYDLLVTQNKGGLKVTGNIKDVMKESSDISYTVARNIVRGTEYESFFNDNLIHLHFPEGATPKDGPSGTV